MGDASSQPLSSEDAPGVLVAGASGYAGALAAQLVWEHPGLRLARTTARSEVGRRLDELYPERPVPVELTELRPAELDGIAAAIVAYPHGASAPVVAALLDSGVRVVDLSADFRLHALPTYERWYGEHGAPALLEGAVYGLTELNRDRIAGAELVANPGCYPTASLLALAPLAEAGLLADVVIDAKSGVSGAGRGAAEEMEVVKRDDDAKAYKVAGHRHAPEIAQELAVLAGVNGEAAPDAKQGSRRRVSMTFVPHLLPFDQGELVSCYAETARELGPDELTSLYERRYGDEPFVQLAEGPPGVSEVRETNLCRIHAVAGESGGRTLVFAVIDNLWKGAASQAVQNLNLMLGLPEGEGISR